MAKRRCNHDPRKTDHVRKTWTIAAGWPNAGRELTMVTCACGAVIEDAHETSTKKNGSI